MDEKKRFAVCFALMTVVVLAAALALAAGGCGADGAKAASDCRNNRMNIAASAVVYENYTGSFPRTVEEMVPGYLSPGPVCPSGGSYTIRPGENGPEVTCSVHGM